MPSIAEKVARRFLMTRRATDNSLGKMVFELAKKHFGSPGGKRWGERSSYDDTQRLVFCDDNGKQPGRGMGRFSTIERLLAKYRDDMPKGLPKFLEQLDTLLKGKNYEPNGLKAVSIAWKGKSGEDEEWSIEIAS